MCYLWSCDDLLCLGLYSKSESTVSSARPLTHNGDLNKRVNETLACVLVSASVSCWEVFQATLLKFLHMADDITLQKNRNETSLEGNGGTGIWKSLSCIHYWKDILDFGETNTVNHTRKHEDKSECSCFIPTF